MNRRRLFVLAAVLGLGLVAAPAIFQMFSRAPKGGDMIEEFRPYMTAERVATFQSEIAQIDDAVNQLQAELPALLEERAGLTADAASQQFPSVVRLQEAWPGIRADMRDDLLVTMEDMVPNFEAVDALPPFPLFPWFFVGPGALVAIVAGIGAWRERQGRSSRRAAIGVAALGVAIVLAPAVFQMFSRAPKGADMINAFRPIMTTERVTTVQGYFLTIGAGEGEWRTEVRPLLVASGDDLADRLPAVERFTAEWPAISNDFAPMIGAMSDNVDNYEAVDALPPFSLFPWFFVVPGLLIAALGAGAAREGRREAPSSNDR